MPEKIGKRCQMGKKKKQVYVVVRGHKPGLYTAWFGKGGAAEQVEGFPQAVYRGFHSLTEAAVWLASQEEDLLFQLPPDLQDLLESCYATSLEDGPESFLEGGKVVIYTDGGAIDNPGPGGYGVVLCYKGHRKELSGGFRSTTNNRMELWACIEGLKALKQPCEVVLYSDSKYVVNGITQGWARKWQANGWKLSKRRKAENVDLWEKLLAQGQQHAVEFRWVRGHAGNPDNERCDQLAVQAALRPNLPPDTAFEAGKTQEASASLFPV
jgi:ribonuclease HI